jgi:hypothetical protein
MTDHTPECLAKNLPLQAEREAWIAKWPNHCKKCEGMGGATVYENASPHGSGEHWMMRVDEPCSCLEACNCPRCGVHNELWEIDDAWEAPGGLVCAYCDWHEQKPDICPPGPDSPCDCMIEEMHAAQEAWWQEEQRWYDEQETHRDLLEGPMHMVVIQDLGIELEPREEKPDLKTNRPRNADPGR